MPRQLRQQAHRTSVRRARTGTTGQALTEKQWQNRVLGLAAFYGWMAYHPPDNRPNANGGKQRVTAGYPDLTLTRDGALIYAELKTDKGRVTTEQQAWLDALAAVPGVEAHVWRPAMEDQVHTRLAEGCVRQEPAW